MQDIEQPLGLIIVQQAPAGEQALRAGVLDDRIKRGEKQHPCHGRTGQRFKHQPEEFAEAHLPFAGQGADHPVDHQEEGLTDEEIVIGQGAGKHHDGEGTALSLLHIQLHTEQHQGKADDRLMKMIEKDIVNGKPGKSVQQPAQKRIVRPHEAAQVQVGGQGGKREFEHQQRRHQIGDGGAGEQEGEPEERTAQKVKGIGAHKIRAKVGCPAPGSVAGTDRVVCHSIKGNLLHIEVAVKDEISPVPDQEREKQQEGGRQREQKCLPGSFAGPAERGCRSVHIRDHSFLSTLVRTCTVDTLSSIAEPG